MALSDANLLKTKKTSIFINIESNVSLESIGRVSFGGGLALFRSRRHDS